MSMTMHPVRDVIRTPCVMSACGPPLGRANLICGHNAAARGMVLRLQQGLICVLTLTESQAMHVQEPCIVVWLVRLGAQRLWRCPSSTGLQRIPQQRHCSGQFGVYCSW